MSILSVYDHDDLSMSDSLSRGWGDERVGWLSRRYSGPDPVCALSLAVTGSGCGNEKKAVQEEVAVAVTALDFILMAFHSIITDTQRQIDL